MRALVAIVAAVFEFIQHCLVMRYSVTILALRDNSMLVGMTEYTLEACVLGSARFK